MLRSLVGSEMCIRDSINAEYGNRNQPTWFGWRWRPTHEIRGSLFQMSSLQLVALLGGACTAAPGLLILGLGFECLRVPGSPVCMGGGVDTAVALISVGMGIMAGGAICCAASHAMRRRSAITSQEGATPACAEMVCGTMGLMVGGSILGFGRLCLRDVHLGACTHLSALLIVCVGGCLVWCGVLLTMTFGYLVNESGGAPRAWVPSPPKPGEFCDLEAAAWTKFPDRVASDNDELEAKALIPPSHVSHRRARSPQLPLN
eukprot:TRINITY_DN20575_c0_g1_i5.p1 TRINITY_DN20575_c0_g1~~TRINITY_DN20575_c0_g1_i5.p1  ORF type:complete len:304 (+),score=103.36 TRINITY_DN20575_c0_g1_i5:133-912(+)